MPFHTIEKWWVKDSILCIDLEPYPQLKMNVSLRYRFLYLKGDSTKFQAKVIAGSEEIIDKVVWFNRKFMSVQKNIDKEASEVAKTKAAIAEYINDHPEDPIIRNYYYLLETENAITTFRQYDKSFNMEGKCTYIWKKTGEISAKPHGYISTEGPWAEYNLESDIACLKAILFLSN